MTDPSLLEQSIDGAKSTLSAAPAARRDELTLLIKDLEEARTTLFVRTAEAKPMLERCAASARALAQAAGSNTWDESAEAAFKEFERAVTKLRNTILVRTQRAT
jgi:hypothetical protein